MEPHQRPDFVIVGSGAGGSVLAYHLARHGARVLVLERGPRVPPDAMTGDEAAMIARLYKDGGAQTNTEADMFLLQGSCVGGSTVLTNAVCFRMPEQVRQSFAQHGFELPRDELADSFARIESVLGVAKLDRSLHNGAVAPIVAGMRRLGLEAQEFDKCLDRCIGCGACNIGCRYGRKLDAAQTWIPMSETHGAVIQPGVEVLRVEHRRGRIHALRCRDRRARRTFAVVADRYVLFGGAINTPELLLRSRILTDRAGRRTSFNAGVIMAAEFAQPLDGAVGDQMCWWHAEDGFILEQIQNPPASFAVTMTAWFDQHAPVMRRFRHLAAAGVLVPTQATGRVFLGLGHRWLRPLFDHADIRFRMPEQDLAVMRRGLMRLAQIFFAAGAQQVFPPVAAGLVLTAPEQIPAIATSIRDQKDLLGFGSSHPQGGAPLGHDDRTDVVAPDWRVRGFANLHVCDASLFPHSIRVNPMLSIMAIADWSVRRIGGFLPPARIDEGPAYEARRREAVQSRPA